MHGSHGGCVMFGDEGAPHPYLQSKKHGCSRFYKKFRQFHFIGWSGYGLDMKYGLSDALMPIQDLWTAYQLSGRFGLKQVASASHI